MSQNLEGQLVRRARRGSQLAFEALQLLLDTPVRRFIRRLIGMHDAEDDIVQDVFLALYLNLERIEPESMLRPFLFRVVRNRSYDILRRQGRYQVMTLDATELNWLVDRAPSPDEQTARLMLYTQVQQSIDALPEVQRQAMILYAEEGLSYAEVAEAMGTTIGTVKSRIHHARRTLRRRIAPDVLRDLGLADSNHE